MEDEHILNAVIQCRPSGRRKEEKITPNLIRTIQYKNLKTQTLCNAIVFASVNCTSKCNNIIIQCNYNRFI